jgi:hypothetical protein
MIAQHMHNNNADVRAATMVAVEAFSSKPKVKVRLDEERR